jgi:hypothetical protein
MKYRILILSNKGKQYISYDCSLDVKHQSINQSTYDIDNKNIKKVMMDDFTSCNHVVFEA